MGIMGIGVNDNIEIKKQLTRKSLYAVISLYPFRIIFLKRYNSPKKLYYKILYIIGNNYIYRDLKFRRG